MNEQRPAAWRTIGSWRRLASLAGYLAYSLTLVVLFFSAAYTSFNLFVRSGVTRAPNLVGLSREEASATLDELGLEWASPQGEGRYSEAVPVGYVVQQQPSPGSLIKRGSRIATVISLGPQRLAVPDVVGVSLAAAQTAISDEGLAMGHIFSVFSDQGRPGTVVEQRPGPSSAVSQETQVDVLVALDSREAVYAMPDLIYRSFVRARRSIEKRGFRIGEVRYEPYEGIPDGVILRHQPPAGHPLTHRDTISLVVASASGSPL